MLPEDDGIVGQKGKDDGSHVSDDGRLKGSLLEQLKEGEANAEVNQRCQNTEEEVVKDFVVE